ncbi:MAG: hypothetical protein QOE90_3323 [Thermoplasmata archaeon]|jgi:hypothetical protein|nr:hypothetical protein [Thermoplasmata archaeon]
MHARRALLVLLLLLVPGLMGLDWITRTAQAAIPYNDADYEIFGQLQVPASSSGFSGGACCPTSSGVTLTSGTTYYFYVATNQGNSISACISSASNSATCDVVSANANGAIVTAGAKASKADLVYSVNVTASPFTHDYMILKVTMAQSVTSYFQSVGSPNNNWGNGWVLPPGAGGSQNARTGILNYVGEWCYGASSCPATTAGYVLLASTPTQLSENGILTTETTKTPSSSEFQWNQIAEGGSLISNSGTTSGSMSSVDWAESFTADATKGSYLSITSWRETFSSACSGTLSVTVSKNLTSPWDPTAEFANLTATITSTATSSTTALVTIDWINGLVSSDNSQLTFGTPSYSIAGQSGASLGALAPPVFTGTYYLHVRDTSCATAQVASPSYYSGGDVWKLVSGTWTESSTLDVQALTLKVYGGTTTIWSLPVTPGNVGGAFYVYVKEILKDTDPQKYLFSTSWGGAARGTSWQEASSTGTSTLACYGYANTFIQACKTTSTWNGCATNGCYVIQEWRLGYLAYPWNQTATLTVTLDTSPIGRNLLYAGTLVGTQPAHPHLNDPTFTATGQNGLKTYSLISTNDYYTSAGFTVYECADASCSTFGAPAPSVAWAATIQSVSTRNLAGSADANATFTVTGQDLSGSTVTLTLTGNGYEPTSWTIRPPNPGLYSFKLGIGKLGQTSGTLPTLNQPTITFSGNTTRIIPDRIWLNLTRSRSANLFVGVDHADPVTGGWTPNVIPAIPWLVSDTNQFQVLYPNRAKSGVADEGLYLVWVMNETGTIIAYQKAFLEPSDVNWTQDDVSITPDVLRRISTTGYQSASESFQADLQASLLQERRTTRDMIYEDFQNVHNYGWWFVGLLFVLATIRAFRR